MNLPLLFLCILIFPGIAFGRRLNFIEAHNLRLSSQTHPLHWINPFSFNRNPGHFETNIFASAEKDVLDLYDDIQSKNEQKLIDRLEKSFGQPYDLEAKIGFGYRTGNFGQYFSTNGGVVLLVTDPVFPELKGFLFHDYTSTTTYYWKPLKGLVIKPSISIGARKILDKSLTTGDLVAKPIDVKFNKAPYRGFVEAGVLVTQNTNGYGHLLFELNSLPLKSSEYQYWETFLGYKTPNFSRKWALPLAELSAFGGYSPFYAGKYDVNRTIKTGIRVAPIKEFNIDFITLDEFYPGLILSYATTHAEFSVFTFERAYDDFGRQKSRQYGFNLKLAW